ncbi:hypothetical protein Zmor_011951, partial [Zophobas morio]
EDLELYRLDQRDNVVRSNQKIRRLTIATLVLVQVGFNVLGILYSSGTKHDKQIIYFLIMSLPRLVYSNMIIIFCVIVQVLHSRFRIVNLVQSKLRPKSDDFCSIVDHILSLHKILVRISRTVNSIFSIQLLLWIAGDFILIVGDLYAAMVIVFVRTLLTHFHVFLGLMKNCLLLGLELFYLSKVCRDLCFEANRTKALLLDLKIDVHAEKEREAVVAAVLKLMNNSLQMTAMRFFSIDNRLLFSICGAAFSYLFIMLQLDLGVGQEEGNKLNVTIKKFD